MDRPSLTYMGRGARSVVKARLSATKHRPPKQLRPGLQSPSLVQVAPHSWPTRTDLQAPSSHSNPHGQPTPLPQTGSTQSRLMHTRPAPHSALFVQGSGAAGNGRGSHLPFWQSVSGGHGIVDEH